MLNFDPIDFVKRSLSYRLDKMKESQTKPSVKNTNNTINTNEFPYKLGPFGICKSSLYKKHFSTINSHENETGFYQIDPRQFKYDQVNNFKILIEFLDYINNKSPTLNLYSFGILGNISPLYLVTLNTESKKYANIPVNATYFSWSYPSILPKNIFEKEKNYKKEKDTNLIKTWMNDPNVILLTVGGYMYFDENRKLLQINTLIPAVDGGLQFGKPKKWDNRFTHELHKMADFKKLQLPLCLERYIYSIFYIIYIYTI